MDLRARLTGCYIAIPTLFRDGDLELNLAGIRRHVRFLLEHGVRTGNGVLLTCGAAGDFSALTADERVQITEAVLDEAAGRVSVVLGAQSTSQREVVELARAASRLGATAIQLSPPFYHAHTDDDIYDFYAAVCDATDVAIVVYNTYWRCGISFDLLDRLAGLRNVAAVKWCSPSVHEYERGVRRFADRLCVIDNQLHFVTSHILGARGINTHSSNFWPEWGVELWNLLEEARYPEAQSAINRGLSPYYDLCDEIARYTGGEGHLDKLCLELIGLDSSRCRPPTRDIRELFREKAREMLKRLEVPHLVRVHSPGTGSSFPRLK